jgi:hypothetical protein
MLLSGLCLLIAPAMMAQEDGEAKAQYRMEDLKRTLLWSESYNAAGLRFVDFQNYSFAEACLGKNDGGFVRYYQSDNSLDYGLRTESYTRVRRVTMYGSLEYNNLLGRNMTNTGFVRPDRYAAGLGDSIPAEKRRETYTLRGAVAAPIYKNLSVGLSIDYNAGNEAKMKDLRTANTSFDLLATGSLLYSNRLLSVGGSYLYRKFHERLTFAQVSPDYNVVGGYYYTGLWFGIFDKWQNTPLGNGTHFFNDVLKGLSLQAGLTLGQLKLMGEATYNTRDGYWGRDRDNALTINTGDIYEYSGRAACSTPHGTHYLNIRTRFEAEDNAIQNIFQEKIGGVTYPTFLGSNSMFRRNTFNIGVEYLVAFGKAEHPSMTFRAGYVNMVRNSSAAVVNPYVYTQSIRRNDLYVEAMKSFDLRRSMIDVSLRLGGGKGYGDVLTRTRIDINPNMEVTAGFGQQRVDLLHREYEYYTAASVDSMIGARYTYFLRAKKQGQSLYGDIRYDARVALGISRVPDDFAGALRLAVGYGF